LEPKLLGELSQGHCGKNMLQVKKRQDVGVVDRKELVVLQPMQELELL
jgi:hypothetical protein